MDYVKILVTGPFNVGKTTLIKTLCGPNVLTTEVELRNPVGEKKTTTVAFDFGKLDMNGRTIYLFGTPGQERFGFMTKVLQEGADLLILLLDEHHARNAEEIRRRYAQLASTGAPMVLGINAKESNPALKEKAKLGQAIRFSAKDRKSAIKLLQAALDVLNQCRRQRVNPPARA